MKSLVFDTPELPEDWAMQIEAFVPSYACVIFMRYNDQRTTPEQVLGWINRIDETFRNHPNATFLFVPRDFNIETLTSEDMQSLGWMKSGDLRELLDAAKAGAGACKALKTLGADTQLPGYEHVTAEIRSAILKFDPEWPY